MQKFYCIYNIHSNTYVVYRQNREIDIYTSSIGGQVLWFGPVKFYLDLMYLHQKRLIPKTFSCRLFGGSFLFLFCCFRLRTCIRGERERRNSREYIEILYRPVSTYPAMHNKYQDDFHHPISQRSYQSCTNRQLRPLSRDTHCII